ncbi:hypothetical protein PPSIR1_07253 [Plesiocystis pacifica SIR-1]|uniref:VWFA domain-containing protein n=1 Tax=Plesiocystis pacifica SIR-1 TaxID=391625 RepID=A6G5A9_9BACT|nr:hypothetical protein [Plesiocystis pacifica]EDM79021.1 hypothetical protein PPSIR1_07253 [Plesiocystis pacifica SIR-1]
MDRRRTLPFALLGLALLPLTSACAPDNDAGSIFTGDAADEIGSEEMDDEGTSTTDSEGSSGGGDSSDEAEAEDESESGPKLDTLPPDTVDDGVGGSEGCESIDVLFVVDISASMNEEKANLNANFPAFVQVLDDYVADPQTAALGYRLGLTNSTIVDNADGQATFGLDGELFPAVGDGFFFPDCNFMGKLWIDGPAPGVTESFTCAAEQPKSDCNNCSDIGKERPLDAIEYFVDKAGPGGVNEGFYRGAESLLVIVLLTDEDDDVQNTTTTPAQTQAILDQFAEGAERYVIVNISGPAVGGCSSAFGDATAAPILHAFTTSVANGVQGDICLGDLSGALDEALDTIVESCDTLPPPIG